MPDLVELVVEDDRWVSFTPPLAGLAERAARAALEAVGLSPEGYEISLLACGDERITELNAEFRGKESPTNVLSWPTHELAPDSPGAVPWLPPEPAGEGPDILGDIAISYETALREAMEQEKRAEDHILHLILHATLHLLGYDHETDADAALMEGIESETLVSMGLPDPYTLPDAEEASLTRQEP
ncbi:rRNA maturation RNase YbeY [Paroceanicella profunda]|uniref:Endoribonuclease YbeY n=1 Tax=Paroceanicella profunda TaxID=2579971 RepID=A0A5B8FGZ3_9RHOB|nr:rRNA maturation RNase YbeY [Paroceanicella profunda]QDL91587.1 rRNA maturation RNase YbeY [Paroceanicella profunda]